MKFKNHQSLFTVATMVLIWTIWGAIKSDPPSDIHEANPSSVTRGAYCASDLANQKWLARHPALQRRAEIIESNLYQSLSNGGANTRTLPSYTLPVVVHIIHDNGSENISDAQIFQGIDDLNASFSNSGYYDQGTGVDTDIQFCLAQRDPDGNTTNGITRDVSALTEMNLESDDIALKDINRWAPLDYINIWVVREICSLSSGCGVAGYAYFPSSHGGANDGIVVEANWFGSSNANSAVITHEMGHYLGLYHTFQGGCGNDDCLLDGDRVCDTPPDQSTAPVPCAATANSCSTDVNAADPNNPFLTDQNDMFWNYMDYGDFDCYSAFTAGQTARMSFSIDNVRSSLLESQACQPACMSPITASFNVDLDPVEIGNTVNFTNTGTGVLNSEWLIDGVSFASTTNTSYTFNSEGSYVITLEVDNADPNCFATFSDTIEVLCPVVADFTASATIVPINEVVTFSNNSVNAGTYEWFVDGVSQGNTTDFSLSLTNPAVVQVCLETTGALCADTHCQFISIIPDGTANCEDTYVSTFGDPQTSEGANVIYPAPDGDFFIGGNRADSALIMKVTPLGQVIWARTFKLTNLDEEIYDLIVDSDGNLVATGFGLNGSDYDCFAFKYDYQNDDVLWGRVMLSPNQSSWRLVVEKAAGSDYIFMGQSQPNGSPGQGCDAFAIELDRNDGTVHWMQNYHLGSCETFQGVYVDGNTMLTAGRFNFAGGGQNRFRASLSRLDLSGQLLWSRLYIVPVNTDARLYSSSVIVDEDQIITAGYGDFNGISTSDVDIYLYATDPDGNMAWTQSYNIAGVTSENTRDLINLPDGYLIQGFLNQGDRDLFLIKTDKQGVAQWAKSYGTNQNDLGFSVITSGESIYLVGTGNAGLPDEDILFYRLNENGDLTGECQGEINELQLTQSLINNPYDGEHPLVEWDPSFTTSATLNLAGQLTSVGSQFLCNEQSCLEICDNGIDDDGDLLVDYFDPDCPCQDTMYCGSPFYNICTPECEVDVPIATFDQEVIWSRQNIRIANGQIVADINGDCTPDVIAVNTSGTLIEVLNSANGNQLFAAPANVASVYTQLAAGDVDNDGQAEIFVVASSGGNRLIRFDYDDGTNSLVQTWASSSTIFSTSAVPAANFSPSLADVDFNGQPEIIVGNQIFNSQTGLELVNGGLNNQGTFPLGSSNFMTSTTVAADVLGDETCVFCQGLELVAGGQVYTINIASYTNPGLNDMTVVRSYSLPGSNQTDGATRLVDFDRDGDLDVVVTATLSATNNARLFVWDIASETLLGNVVDFLPNPNNNERIGAAAIGDVDNDGWAEIIVATSFNFNIVEDYQAGGGTNWGANPATTIKATISTTDQSGATGATVFDLNGDGAVEIIYRDEQNLRVFDGDLNVISSISCTSGTATEYPVVADVNGDNETEFLCGCNNIGLTTFRSANLPWVRARKIWNQYNYFVSNVLDNGAIPIQQQNPHLVGDGVIMNAFLLQQPILDDSGTPINPAPDAVVAIDSAACAEDLINVWGTICNAGDFPLTASTPVTVYLGDPTVIPNPEIVETFPLGTQLEEDSCLNISYSIPFAINQPIFFVVNDNGQGPFPFDLLTDFPLTEIGECDYSNNIANTQVDGDIPPPLDLGPDILICDNGVFELDAGAGFDNYLWQDGTMESTYLAWAPGSYWVSAWNDCGPIQTDTIQIIVDETTVIDLVADTVLCGGGSVTLTVEGFDDYQWFPSVDIDCTNCATVTITPSVSQVYTVVGSTSLGCISVDSVAVIVAEPFYTELDTTICDGDIFIFNGESLETNTSTLFTFTTAEGCDSSILVNVNSNGSMGSFETIDTAICSGTSVIIDGVTIPADSTHVFEYMAQNGCDSIIQVAVSALDTFYQESNSFICEGESIIIFGNEVSTPGTYSMTFTADNGCDSTEVIQLTVFDMPQIEFITLPSCPNDSTGSITATVTGGTGTIIYDWNVNVGNVNQLENLPSGDYALTVTDGNNCSATATVTIVDINDQVLQGISTPVSCFGFDDGVYQIDSSFNGYLFSLDGEFYQGSLIFDGLAAGTYDLYLQDEINDCEFIQSFTIESPPELLVSLPEDTVLVLGCPIELQSIVNRSDSIIYSWSPSLYLDCIDCPAPIALPENDILYNLVVSDTNGCIAQDEIFIDIDKLRRVFIPNVFTPNGDGENDILTVFAGKDVELVLEFNIFDRWGEQVFGANNFLPNDLTFGWDGYFKGKPMNPGVFVYMARVQFLDGETSLLSGTITLIK